MLDLATGTSSFPPWKKRLYDGYVSTGPSRNVGRKAESLLAPRAAYIKDLIARYLRLNLNANIVDLGCGYGAFLHFLQAAGYRNITGIDTSLEQIALAHELGIGHVQHGQIEDFLRCTKSSSIDAVLLMDILEHLEVDKMFGILDEVLRVLRPSGICIAHVPNAEGIFGMRIRYGDMTHEHAFTARSADQVFRAVGFNTVECYEERPVVHGTKSLFRRVLWDLGTLAHRILLTAETGSFDCVLSQNVLIRAVKL